MPHRQCSSRPEGAALPAPISSRWRNRRNFCVAPRASIRADSRRWAMTWKSSACGRAQTSFAIRMAGLRIYFCELEKNADWLETSTPGDAVASHPSLGRADLPTASYTEMMEWALPTAARVRYHALTEEFASRPESLPFLRGGIWRNFFTKYCESNLLQKKMLHVSGKVQKLCRERLARQGICASGRSGCIASIAQPVQ